MTVFDYMILGILLGVMALLAITVFVLVVVFIVSVFRDEFSKKKGGE